MGFRRHPWGQAAMTVFALLLYAAPAAATSHSTGSVLIEVSAATATETLAENPAERIGAIPGVSRVERYLLIRGDRNDKIGVEPGAPLRIVTKDGNLVEGKAEFGRNFRNTDAGKTVALVNRVTYAAQGMSGMEHYLGVGQSFTLEESRFRIVGEVTAPTEHKIFMPLDTAQRLYGKEGVVTHFFVSVADKKQADAVRKTLAETLGPSVSLTRH